MSKIPFIMKKVIMSVAAAALLSLSTMAQVAINTDGSAANSSALLDVKSTTKGVLVPRMTIEERNLISQPAAGLLVFCTNNNQYFMNQGTPATPSWQVMNSQWMTTGSNISYNSGNIGLGTSSPAGLLHLNNINSPIILFTNPTTGTTGNDGGAIYQLENDFYFDNIENGSLKFFDYGLERMTITSAGNVGIGTPTPSFKLQVDNADGPQLSLHNPDNATGELAGLKFSTASGWSVELRTNQETSYLELFGAGAVKHRWYDVNYYPGNGSAYITGSGSNLSLMDGNVGIGTTTPAESAVLEINSTDKGFLMPRLTLGQIQSISFPENGLQVFCTTDNKMYIYVATATLWKEVAYGTATIAPPSYSCGSITINHIAGAVAPVTKTIIYGTVYNIPGEPLKCWITSNLGADHQATSVDDATEASAGWYWQFNRMQGFKHDGTTRTPGTAWITSINENFDWQAAYDPCAIELGGGWRLPTSTEWTNVDASWNEWNDPWDSGLHLHAAGSLSYSNGSLSVRGSSGLYWSSSQDNFNYGWYLRFAISSCFMNNNEKASGYSIRCLRDS
jgi:hypothetical protein